MSETSEPGLRNPPALAGLPKSSPESGDLITRPGAEDLPALAAGLVHEAKNPLASIHLHLQLLEAYLSEVKEDDLRKKLSEKVRFIQKEISQLDQSLHNFLRAIRQERRSLSGKINLNQILEGVRELLNPQARQEGIRLETQFAEPPPLALADEGFVKQIAINLILNAMQAFADTSESEEAAEARFPSDPVIILKTGAREGHSYFMVADNGPGIPEDLREKIFEPWYTTKAAKGSGIGLALVKKMIAEMGAHLELQTKTGQGSSFRIIFPKLEKNEL